MSLERVLKQLRREAAGSPKKAVILGIMLLVGVYFWAPLVAGWVKPAAGAPPNQPTPTLAEMMSSSRGESTNTAAVKENTVKHTWQQLIEWSANDPRARSAAEWPDVGDPFHQAAPEPGLADTKKEEAKPPVEEKNLSPKELGLVLSGTVVGPHVAVARISGKSYPKGADVSIAHEGKDWVFHLAEIHPRRVVLQRKGEAFELKIPVGSGEAKAESPPAQ